MQVFSTNINYFCDDATGQLKDSRDSQVYTVGIITANNGGASKTLWMTRNIAIGCNGSGTTYGSGRKSGGVALDSSNSNVSTTWSTGNAWNLNASSTQYTSDSTCKGSTTSGCNSYTQARMECSSTYGAWYNYVAATANTINTADNSTDAEKDICPSGWRLPNHSEISAAASNKTAFSPVTGGHYGGGTLNSTGYGRWWSNGALSGTTRWYLKYNGTYLSTDYYSRYYGFYVRCVRSS